MNSCHRLQSGFDPVRVWLCAFVSLSIAIVPGCGLLGPRNSPLDFAYDDPVLPAMVKQLPLSSGSIYTEQAGLQLFGDHKAYRPGDVLTVVLDESTRSSKKAGTTLAKGGSTDIQPPVVGPFDGSKHSLSASLASAHDFSGKASAAQQNLLTGAVTVMVQRVLDNGVLSVRGRKVVRLNHGDEVIFVSGLVRSEDVSDDNRVSSRRLANARISYTGEGDLANSNTMGWLSRLLNSRWFPF